MSPGARIVVISGAAAGIGKAMAEAFARQGDHLVLLDIDPAGEKVAASLAGNGGGAEFHALDVAKWDEVEAVIDGVARTHGEITVCVANAGIARRVPVTEMDEAAWNLVLNVNLRGTAQLLRCAAMHMAKPGEGVLIALSSISARLGWPDHVHYNASKAGIEGLVRGLAVELGPKGIRANAILPGVIRTAQSLSEEHSLGPDGLRDVARRIPLQRVGEPCDIADVALFLASDAARYVTGQSIIVDGGMTVGSY